jgi:hypothetical protein
MKMTEKIHLGLKWMLQKNGLERIPEALCLPVQRYDVIIQGQIGLQPHVVVCSWHPTVKAAAQINVLSNGGWLDSSGYYHVSGETRTPKE